MPDIPYKRLTRASARARFAVAVRARAALWLGPDHILSVESDNFRESYKRFYFRDIQAILVQKTKHFQIWTGILGVLSVIALACSLAFIRPALPDFSGPAASGVFIFGIMFVVVFVVFVVHLMRGQTCRTYLRTAVQIEELPSLKRVKRTRHVLAKIRPLIVAAQGGELSPEAISAQMREWTAPAPTATAAPDAVTDDPNVPPRL